MKNKINKILVYALILAALIPCIGVGASSEAYSGEIYFHDADSYTGNLTIDSDNGYVGDTAQGNTMTFNSVDFGTNYPYEISVTYGIGSNYNNTKMSVAIDSSDNIIGTLTFTNTGGWTSFKTVSKELNASSITGVHDLIFICDTSPVGNLKSFKFSWEHDKVISPVITLTDRFNGETTNIATARNITVTAGIDRNTGNNLAPEKVMLLSALYDDNGSMISVKGVEETAIDGQYTPLNISKYSKTTGAASVSAFFWNESYVPKAPAVFINPYSRGTSTSKDLNVTLSGATVKICGYSVSDNVIIMVLPNNAEKNWQNAVQLYELPVENNSYEYTFRMNDSVASGKYRVWVKGNEDSFEKTFDFISMNDFYDVLYYLDTQTDETLIVDKLESSAYMFGLSDIFFNNLTNDMKKTVKEGIKQAFTDYPLVKSDEYSKWTDAIRENILGDLFVFYINLNPSFSEIEAMLTNYSSELLIDNANYTKYFTKESKTAVSQALINNPPQTKSEIAQKFTDALIVGCVNSAGAWGNIDSVLMEFSQTLGIDISRYRRFSNTVKASVCESFFDINFGSVGAIRSHFETVIAGYADEEAEEGTHPKLEIKKGDIIASMAVSTPNISTDKEIVSQFKGFDDMDGFEWAQEAVQMLAKCGIIQGKSENEFAPGDKIKREEFVSLIMRVFEFDTANVSNIKFNDVKDTDWFAADIGRAVELGIIKGINEETFGTGMNITRQDAVTVIVRAADAAGKLIMPKYSSIAFTDANQISDYAYSAVTELTRSGIVNGVSVDKFSPLSDTTRAETAVMLMRLILNMK